MSFSPPSALEPPPPPIPLEQRLAALSPQERTRRTALRTGLDRIQSE
jgi:hypothetical protein